MTAASKSADFIPAYNEIAFDELLDALAPLGATEVHLGIFIPLRYTTRADGTYDSIEVGRYSGGSGDWMIYFARCYRGEGSTNITAQVGRFPGHLVILVVHALHAYLSALPTMTDLDETVGDIVYALGLDRGPRLDARIGRATGSEGL